MTTDDSLRVLAHEARKAIKQTEHGATEFAMRDFEEALERAMFEFEKRDVCLWWIRWSKAHKYD